MILIMENYQNKNLPLISVIVPCRNEEKFIAECLKSVVQQNYPKNKMEIFVTDGMSEDGTRDIIKNYSKKYSFIKLLENYKKIKPAALNMGVKQANGEYIIIMDAHAKYKNNYISKCIETSIKYNADNTGGVWKILPQQNTLINKAIVSASSSIFGTGNAYYKRGYSKKIKEVDTVFGGCYKKEIFDKIGFFNENLVRCQDIEFNIRLKKYGGKILLNPEIICYYYPKTTNLKTFSRYSFKTGVWSIYSLKIAKTHLKLRHYISLVFVTGLLGTGLLGIFFLNFLWLFLFIISLYILFNLYFSIKIAIKEKNFKYIFIMPLLFCIRHIVYGLGSIWGLITVFIIK